VTRSLPSQLYQGAGDHRHDRVGCRGLRERDRQPVGGGQHPAACTSRIAAFLGLRNQATGSCELDFIQRLRFYTTAMLNGSISPKHVEEDWPDWYQLAPAFVAAYGTEELKQLEDAATFVRAVEEHDDVSITEADRAYLKVLVAWLDMYPEMRASEE